MVLFFPGKDRERGGISFGGHHLPLYMQVYTFISSSFGIWEIGWLIKPLGFLAYTFWSHWPPTFLGYYFGVVIPYWAAPRYLIKIKIKAFLNFNFIQILTLVMLSKAPTCLPYLTRLLLLRCARRDGCHERKSTSGHVTGHMTTWQHARKGRGQGWWLQKFCTIICSNVGLYWSKVIPYWASPR